MARRRALLLGLLLCLITPTQAAQKRPLVVVFAATYAGDPAARARALKPEDTEPPDLALLAMRAVRERLADVNVVDTLAFLPDSPTFLREVAERKLAVNLKEPTREDRIALARAVGASYIVTVLTEREAQGGITVELQAIEIASGKPWMGRERAQSTRAANPVPVTASSPFPDDLLSAANTVVRKFVDGMLSGAAAIVPPGLAPPPLRPNTPPLDTQAGDPPPDPQVIARVALQQGEALLAAGDANGAILAFRQAVNATPRSASARASLVRAYLTARRGTDAVAEVRRALVLIPASDTAGQVALTRLLAQGLMASGDTTAARATYEQIIYAHPRALWARLALADLLIAQGRFADAEAQYRAARQVEPGNREVLERVARLKAARGDYAGALEEMDALRSDPAAKYAVARDLFEGGLNGVVAAVMQDRKAFDDGKLSREAFYKSASAQADRAGSLLALVKSAPPAGDDLRLRAHRQRVLAASLLTQATASLLTYLETGETAAGSQANLLLNEARKESAQAKATEAQAGPERAGDAS